MENARRLFLDYLREINSLREQPEFYNSLTTNCTTNIWMHTRVNPGHLPFSWKLLVSGHVPEYLYEAGGSTRASPSRSCSGADTSTRRAQAADGRGLLAADPGARPCPSLMREVAARPVAPWSNSEAGRKP